MKVFSFKAILLLLIFPVLLVVLHGYFILSNFYDSYPWFDIPMHMVGGAYFGFVFFLILKSLQERHLLILSSTARIVFVVSLVALTAVVWEWAEFLAEFSTGIDFQGADINADLFFGLSGGLIGAFLCEMMSPKIYSKSK